VDEPLFLYHYYEAAIGPFRSLSELDRAAAEDVLQHLRDAGLTFAAWRGPDYLAVRREIERRIREQFVRKGGQPRRAHPHYLVVGPCAWLRGWYRDGRAARVALAAIRPEAVSFTYGDSFPAMRFQDGKPYRG
jgi:hypothetical protein